jgi:hypothetical protein
MRGISLKAFLIGNVLTVVLGIVSTLVLLLVAGAIVKSPGASMTDTMHALQSRAWFNALMGVTTVLYFVVAGYVSARLSKSHLLLNGALSATVVTVVNIYEATRTASGLDNSELLAAVSWAAPVFAAGGAYLRLMQLRHRQETNQSATVPNNQGARTMFGDLALAVLALLAAIIAFFSMLILDKANPSFAIILAIVAGMVAGTLIAPPRYMWLAPKIFFGLAVLAAVGIFLRAVVAGNVTFAHYFALLSVVIAGFLGRQMLTLKRPAVDAAPDGKWRRRAIARIILFAYILCLWFFATADGSANPLLHATLRSIVLGAPAIPIIWLVLRLRSDPQARQRAKTTYDKVLAEQREKAVAHPYRSKARYLLSLVVAGFFGFVLGFNVTMRLQGLTSIEAPERVPIALAVGVFIACLTVLLAKPYLKRRDIA